MTKFIIPPEQQSYSFEYGKESISTELEGGAGRYRKDIANASYKLNCLWVLNPLQYRYARSFYRSVTDSGSLPFTIDLLTDFADELEEHIVYFIPGSFKLSSTQGRMMTVTATLEVIPNDPADTDEDFVYLYNEFGDQYDEFMDELNILMNTTIPDDLV